MRSRIKPRLMARIAVGAAPCRISRTSRANTPVNVIVPKPLPPTRTASSAVPTVTTDVGGLAEVVLDSQTGFFAPVGDIEALSSRVLQLLQDEGLARTMGRAGRNRAQQLFDQTKVVPRYLALYQKVLSS